MPKFLEDERAWAAKWNLVKTCKGFVPANHPAAINKAKRLSGDTSSDVPPLPTAYPKALDMWSRDLKETYRTKFPRQSSGSAEEDEGRLGGGLMKTPSKPTTSAEARSSRRSTLRGIVSGRRSS